MSNQTSPNQCSFINPLGTPKFLKQSLNRVWYYFTFFGSHTKITRKFKSTLYSF